MKILHQVLNNLFRMRVMNFVLVVLSLFFSLIIFELYLQVVDEVFTTPKPGSIWAEDSDYPLNYFEQPLEFGSGARPGTYRAHKIAPNGLDVFNVEYDIGSDGFRTTSGKIDVAHRVNFFGGSFTFGEALQSGETLPSHFKSFLSDYYVKNFGFHGYGAHEALAILESDHDTKGDINFLLTAPWHAERMRCIAGSSSSSSPVYRLNKYDKVMRSGNCLSEINSGNSFKRDFHELTYIVGGSKLATLYNRTSKRKAESIRDDEIDLYIKVIAKISFLSKNRGQKFIVGYIKSENDYFKDTKFSNSIIMDRIRKAGAHVIDMTLSVDAETLLDKYVVHPEYERHPDRKSVG